MSGLLNSSFTIHRWPREDITNYRPLAPASLSVSAEKNGILSSEFGSLHWQGGLEDEKRQAAGDDRPLEDLLNFIENGKADSGRAAGAKKAANGKRKKKAKGRQANHPDHLPPSCAGQATTVPKDSMIAEPPSSSNEVMPCLVACCDFLRISLREFTGAG
eukprot:scaffold232692_cov30-Prasinocladus_malaysianus.AAC.1